MAIYIDKKNNALIFNEEDYDININYLEDIAGALKELDPQKDIYFNLDLSKTPMSFLIYFRSLKKTTPHVNIHYYFKDKHELLPKVLESYGLKYNNNSSFPYPLSLVQEEI